jgi:hypothetical protein
MNKSYALLMVVMMVVDGVRLMVQRSVESNTHGGGCGHWVRCVNRLDGHHGHRVPSDRNRGAGDTQGARRLPAAAVGRRGWWSGHGHKGSDRGSEVAATNTGTVMVVVSNRSHVLGRRLLR